MKKKEIKKVTTAKTTGKAKAPAAKKATVKTTSHKKTSSKPALKSNVKKKEVYKKTTDKVGDILINQAGVKYKITGEKFAAATGYDDGKLKLRFLQITPDKKTGISAFEILDTNVKIYRDTKILKRVKNVEKRK